MVQFDVHLNLGRSRGLYPYLVVVQSGHMRRWDRRVVVPLAIAEPLSTVPDPKLNPVVIVGDSRAYVAAQEIANVPLDALGDVVANLRDDAETIIGALDWMLSQGFG
jgi:hypothetical protein